MSVLYLVGELKHILSKPCLCQIDSTQIAHLLIGKEQQSFWMLLIDVWGFLFLRLHVTAQEIFQSLFLHCWSTVDGQLNMFAVFDYHTVYFQRNNQFKWGLVAILCHNKNVCVGVILDKHCGSVNRWCFWLKVKDLCIMSSLDN